MNTVTLEPTPAQITQCEYAVRKNTINGAEARIAELGETLYHTWICTGGGKEALLVIAHNVMQHLTCAYW